jgi:hypothetical protein
MTSSIDIQTNPDFPSLLSVNIGHVPLLDLITAVENGDEAAVWTYLHNHDIASEQFFGLLRDMSCEYTHQLDASKARPGLRSFQESCLVMCPVVHSCPQMDCSSNGVEAMDNRFSSRLRDELQAWGRHLSSARVLTPLLDHRRLFQMGPLGLRNVLRQIAMNQAEQNPALFGSYQAPEHPHLPQLSFLLMVMTRLNGSPFIPSEVSKSAPLRDLLDSFVQWMAMPAGGAAYSSPFFRVGMPMMGPDAMEAGLMMWLTALHQSHGIVHWDLQVEAANQFRLQLVVDEASLIQTSCLLPPHQLGTDGVERVLAHVAGLAGQRTSMEAAN